MIDMKNNRDFVKKVDEELKNNKEKMNIREKKKLQVLRNLINIEYSIFEISIADFMFGMTTEEDAYLSMEYKMLVSLYTCLKLNEVSLYGEAKMIYRNIYETLIVLKGIRVKKSRKLFEQWYNLNKNISIQDKILNPIKKPDNSNLKQFYKYLCTYCHSNPVMGQMINEDDHKCGELKESIIMLEILILMNYFFLINFVTTKSKYNLKTYAPDHFGKYKDLKKQFNLKKKICIIDLN